MELEKWKFHKWEGGGQKRGVRQSNNITKLKSKALAVWRLMKLNTKEKYDYSKKFNFRFQKQVGTYIQKM